MTTPVREQEAAQASSAFHAALMATGTDAAADALREWERVPVGARPTAIDRWVRRTASVVVEGRSLARLLALAYYRLIRALHVGETIPDPRGPARATETLNDLRRDFAEALEDAAGPGGATPLPGSGDTYDLNDYLSDNASVTVEELEGMEDLADEQDDEAMDELAEILPLVGPGREKKAAKRHEDPDRKEQAVRDAHDTGGVVQASHVARLVRDGGRDYTNSLGRKDGKALGYVRLSRTGTPCGFCATMMSRGMILYESAETAGGFLSADGKTRYGGDEWHPNCQCYAEPVFSRSHYENHPMFALNREMTRLYNRVAQGKANPINEMRKALTSARTADPSQTEAEDPESEAA